MRDRRASLDGPPSLHVAPESACDPLVVDPAVLVVAAVLDRDRPLRQPLGHPRELMGSRLARRGSSRAPTRRRRRRTSSVRSPPVAGCSGRSSRGRRAAAEPPPSRRRSATARRNEPQEDGGARRFRTRSLRFLRRMRCAALASGRQRRRSRESIRRRPQSARAPSRRRSLSARSRAARPRPVRGRRWLRRLEIRHVHLFASRERRDDRAQVGRQRDVTFTSASVSGCGSWSCGWYPSELLVRDHDRSLLRASDPRVRRPISSTTPFVPAISTSSPRRSGWVNAIRIPATKLPIVRWLRTRHEPDHRGRRENASRDRLHLRNHQERRQHADEHDHVKIDRRRTR